MPITLATARVGDRIRFAEGRMPFTVQARDRRFIICTRPFPLRKTVLYTVLDLQLGVRGPDDRVFCFGYETREACRERLQDFHRRDDPTRVSRRHGIALKVHSITRPEGSCS